MKDSVKRSEAMKILRLLPLFITFLTAPLGVTPLSAEDASLTFSKQLVIHRVSKGEELHLLAGYYLLNAREWDKIYKWNSGLIKNKNLIYPGQELTVYVSKNWKPPYDLDKYVRSIGRR